MKTYKTEIEIIFEKIQEFRDGHSTLLKTALRDGLTKVKEYSATNKYLSRYYQYPELSYHSNGMPHLSNSLTAGPVEYRGCFGSPSDGKINSDEISSFSDLIEYVKNKTDLTNQILPSFLKNNPKLDELNIEFDKLYIIGTIKDAIESYIHNYKDFEYSEEKANETIEPLLNKIDFSPISVPLQG